MSSPSAKERVQGAASTATDEGRHVAGVAKEEAQNVAATAAQQARGLFDQTRSQVGDQTRMQRDRLAGTLRTVGDDLERMASESGGSGLATDLAREVAERTKRFSSRLEEREPGELIEEVRDFARRRPGVFLLGAMAAGVVAGRLARGATAGMGEGEQQMIAQPSMSSSGAETMGESPMDTPGAMTPPMPSATPGQPTVPPAYTEHPGVGGTP